MVEGRRRSPDGELTMSLLLTAAIALASAALGGAVIYLLMTLRARRAAAEFTAHLDETLTAAQATIGDMAPYLSAAIASYVEDHCEAANATNN